MASLLTALLRSRAFLMGALLLILGVAMLENAYVVQRMVMPPPLEDPFRWAYRISYCLTFPVRDIADRVAHPTTLTQRQMVSALSYILTPFVWFGFWRLLRWWRRRLKPCVPASRAGGISRRQFLRASGTGSLAAVGAVAGYGTILEPQRVVVREYRIAIPDLPASLDGLRLAQISDTHYGNFTSARFIEEVIDTANGLDPDLYVLTGDYIFAPRIAVPTAVGLFKGLRSRLGAVAVLGNHDHYSDARVCRLEFDKLGLPLVDNAHLYLTADGLRTTPAPESLCVAGVGDKWTDVVSFPKALDGVPDTVPRLLLSHNPYVADRVPAAYRVDLMLSGHTHGGQVCLPVIGPPATFFGVPHRYLGGVYDTPGCRLLVSRGIGTVNLPIRIGVPPEICHVTLVRASSAQPSRE